MRLAHHTIWIARTPAEVFDFFVDFSQAPRWRQHVTAMRQVSDGPLAPGSRVDVHIDRAGTPSSYQLEVLAIDPPRSWRHHTNDRHFRGYTEYRFDPEDDGTRVTMTMKARPADLSGWLSVPLLLFRRRQPYSEQLPRLKRALEG